MGSSSRIDVLVTGAYGHIGAQVLRLLAERGKRARAFDVPSRANKRRAARLPEPTDVVWGDLRDAGAIAQALDGVGTVIHLAFVIPPASERDPDLARAVNVEGTRLLLDGMQRLEETCRLVFASSFAIYGDTRHLDELLTPASPLSPPSHYTRHKVETEEMVRESGIQACILRLGAVLSAEMVLGGSIDPLIFDLPHDSKQEIIHTEDAALAICNCLERNEVWDKTLLIGGGASCQVTYDDLINRSLEALGIGALPLDAFSREAHQGGGWMDTEESERILQYQRCTFDSHLEELRQKAGARRVFAKALAPAIRWYIVRQSPYRAAAP